MSILDTIVTWMWRVGVTSVGILAFAGGLLYTQQEKLLYLPSVQGIPRHNRDNPKGYRSPSERGLKHWYSVRIPTSDGTTIHAWYIIHPSAMEAKAAAAADATAATAPKAPQKLPTLIFFHGNAGNIGLRLPNVEYMMHYLGAVNILLVDYRGYGDSDDASPTERGLQRDGQAAYEWIVSAAEADGSTTTTTTPAQVEASNTLMEQTTPSAFIDTSKLYLFGRSLGGAVAFQLAHYIQEQRQQSSSSSSKKTLPPLAGLIVENTFLNISSMVDRIFPFLKPLKPFVLRMHWDSHACAAKLRHVPILYLAGARDDLVPHHHMQALYLTSLMAMEQQGANSDKNKKAIQLHVVPDGTHNETWLQGGSAYWKAIRAFLAQTSRSGGTDDKAANMDHAATTTTLNGSENDSSANVIPTMSQNVVDMAKQAFSSSSSSTTARDDGLKKKQS